MQVPKPYIKVLYDGVNISEDITRHLISLTYTDKVAGETDEIELQLEDIDALWRNEWYPTKGSKLTVEIGDGVNKVSCGTFSIDEIELSGPPDTVSIRGIAAHVTAKMRTKNSKAYEGVSLKQIAEDIARKHKMTLDDGTQTITTTRPNTKEEQAKLKVLADFAAKAGTENDKLKRTTQITAIVIKLGEVKTSLNQKGYPDEVTDIIKIVQYIQADNTTKGAVNLSTLITKLISKLINEPLKSKRTLSLGLHDIKVERSTQNRETDLGYLSRIAGEYGLAFSIKNTLMVFYNIFSLEDSPSVTKVDRKDLISYSLKDKTQGTYKDAKVKHHDPKTNKVVDGSYNVETKTNVDGVNYTEITKEDTLEIRTKAENGKQADAKAKAALHKHNSRAQEGSLSIIGNPLLVAGNNFELTGMGVLSGKYHISQSTHNISKDGGYTTDIELKRIERSGKAAQKTGGYGGRDKKYVVENRQNVDNVGYTQIRVQ